jgi:hypothetical protein
MGNKYAESLPKQIDPHVFYCDFAICIKFKKYMIMAGEFYPKFLNLL